MTTFSPSRRCFCAAVAATALVAPRSATAQARTLSGPMCCFSITDGWSDQPARYIARQAGSDDPSGVPQAARRITNALGVHVDFDILIAEAENNAMAMIAQGRRLLVVDVGFLRRLNRVAGTQWAAIQVIAHEIGHHVAGFSTDRHRNEFNADYWSGQSLQGLGSARRAAMASILAVGTDVDTATHPNRHARAATIARGWDDAQRGVVDRAFCYDCR